VCVVCVVTWCLVHVAFVDANTQRRVH